jgi:hypothetical protein
MNAPRECIRLTDRVCCDIIRNMRCGKSFSQIFFLFILLFVFFHSTPASAGSNPGIINEDCIKCHTDQPADISSAGGKHAGIGCSGCHIGHPPEIKKPVPRCSECHSGKPHYKIASCLNCHNNPHTPLIISFRGRMTDECLSCHTQQITQLRKNKSRHTNLNCSFCHKAHGKAPQCVQCHKSHSDEMTAADCGRCHKAHMPKVVTYAPETPSRECGICHKKAVDLLSASKLRHNRFECSFCHNAKHKLIPRCQDCHGSPHPAGMMSQFPKCGKCHNSAHDLNNWRGDDKEVRGKLQPL